MTNGQASKLEVSTPAEREIRIERVFDHPRDVVFATYMDPELIPDWWGPHGTTAEVERMEPETGGRWRFVIHNSDGTTTGFQGSFREVTPPERIVQTFEWDGMPGHVSVDTTEFEDLGDGRTKVITTSLFHTSEERDGMLAGGMADGAGETYERLDAVLANRA